MQTIKEIYDFLMGIMEQITVFLIGLSLVVLLWGVVKYFRYSDSADKRKSSRSYMVYGIISLFVVTTLWGLVYFVGDVVGIDIRKNEGNFYESIDNNNPTSGLVNDGGFTESINGTNNQGTVNTNNMIDLYDNQIKTKNPLINTLQGDK